MKLKERQERNYKVLRKLLGDWEGRPGISIESDYLVREKIENARESGFSVPEVDSFACSAEREERRHNKMMEQLETERCPRYTQPYDGREIRATWNQRRAIYRIAKTKGVEVDRVFMDDCSLEEASNYIQELIGIPRKMEVVEL